MIIITNTNDNSHSNDTKLVYREAWRIETRVERARHGGMDSGRRDQAGEEEDGTGQGWAGWKETSSGWLRLCFSPLKHSLVLFYLNGNKRESNGALG